MAGCAAKVPLSGFAAVVLLLVAPPLRAAETSEFIAWLLKDGQAMKDLPFPEVLEATTGRKIFPVDPKADHEWLAALSGALDRTIAALNDPKEGIHGAGRINEASRFIEDRLMKEVAALPGWTCGVPRTPSGGEQRSGYPDLRATLPDGRVVFLDPKLFAPGSRSSSLRTFYYEPKSLTSKVNDDGFHLLVGVQHNDGTGADLRLLGWELVDVSRLRVQLKAEFQASNRDIYTADNVVASSAPAKDSPQNR